MGESVSVLISPVEHLAQQRGSERVLKTGRFKMDALCHSLGSLGEFGFDREGPVTTTTTLEVAGLIPGFS